MNPQAIVQRREVAQERAVAPKLKIARPLSHKPKEGSLYDPELGVGVRMAPLTVAEKFSRIGRAIKLHMKGILDVASEPSPTRTVKVSADELFAPPSVKVERRAEL